MLYIVIVKDFVTLISLIVYVMRKCVTTSKQDSMISHYDVNVITTHMRITSSLLRLKEVYD